MHGGQKLKAWMKRNKRTARHVGEVLDMWQANVSRICTGSVRPNLDTAIAIERMTGGEVAPRDFARQEKDGEETGKEERAVA
jgi:transcriptional regulator with XRE-family HTH domain